MNSSNSQARFPTSVVIPLARPLPLLMPTERVIPQTLTKRSWCRVGGMLLCYDGRLADRVSYCLIQSDPTQKFGRRMKPIFLGFGDGDVRTMSMANGAKIELVSGTANKVMIRIQTYLCFQRRLLGLGD
jgi:hypothetical protein